MKDEIRKLGKNFSKAELLSVWDDLDRKNQSLLQAVLKKASENGALSFVIDEESGGAGLSVADFCVFIEEVSGSCAGMGAVLAAHLHGVAPLLLLKDNTTAKIFLSMIGSAQERGEAALFAPAIYEGCDRKIFPEQINTSFREENGSVAISGAKTNVACGSAAAFFTLIAKSEVSGAVAIIVVPSQSEGVEVKDEKARLGLRFCPVNNVVFENVKVPFSNIIKENADEDFFRKWFEYSEPAFAAVAIGMAIEARAAAFKYSLERYQGGKMICDHDVIRMMLFDMEVRLRASRSLAYGPEAGLFASEYAAEAAEKTCLDAIQIHGGYGYIKDYRVERILRDAKTFRALAGSQARGIQYVGEEIEKTK